MRKWLLKHTVVSTSASKYLKMLGFVMGTLLLQLLRKPFQCLAVLTCYIFWGNPQIEITWSNIAHINTGGVTMNSLPPSLQHLLDCPFMLMAALACQWIKSLLHWAMLPQAMCNGYLLSILQVKHVQSDTTWLVFCTAWSWAYPALEPPGNMLKFVDMITLCTTIRYLNIVSIKFWISWRPLLAAMATQHI
jgi:hypothetical protein